MVSFFDLLNPLSQKWVGTSLSMQVTYPNYLIVIYLGGMLGTLIMAGFLFHHGYCSKLYNESTFYSGLSGSLAEYFHSACIYFLTDSREQGKRRD